MKVTLATHGGLAAAIRMRSPAQAVDGDALPKAAAAELARLVAAAKAAPARAEENPGRGADLMAYTITVEDDGPPVTLQQSQTTMSPAFDALRRWIEAQAKRG
jgi:hypothetical protein